MPRPNGKQVTHTITSTSEVTVMDKIYSNRDTNRGLTVAVKTTQAGTAKIKYTWTDGTNLELDSKVMTADSFHLFDFDFPVPESVVTFDADSASGTVTVEAIVY